jgi:hypothetical protein
MYLQLLNLARVKSEILYLPRTTTRYSRPYLPLPNSEKLRPCSDEEWSVTFIPQKGKVMPSATSASSSKAQNQPHSSLPQSVGDDVVVRLWLPDGLRYPAGRQILWSVTFVFPRTSSTASSTISGSSKSTSGMSDCDIDALVSGISLRLVCISTVAVRGAASRRERVVAVGELFNVRPDARTDLGEKKVIVMGCLQSGEAERDMSWGVRGFVSVVVSNAESPELKKNNIVGLARDTGIDQTRWAQRTSLGILRTNNDYIS